MSQPLFVYFEIVHPSVRVKTGETLGMGMGMERQSFGIFGYMRICDGITSTISRGIC